MAIGTHLSLFTGIGGLDLAAEAAGFRTVGQCEWADYPIKILERHWPDVQRWRDVRTLTRESFYERTGMRTVDIISGGFPCQPFSIAGKRRGKEDDRYLWPEMCRVIQELGPSWVVGENVAGFVSMAVDEVLADLESAGYTCRAFIIPACAVNAPHRRDRCAIIGARKSRKEWQALCGDADRNLAFQVEKISAWYNESGGICRDVADADSARLQREQQPAAYAKAAAQCGENVHRKSGGAAKPRMGGMDNGLSYWLDEPAGIPRTTEKTPDRGKRLKCLGNAVVPQQFYPIFKAIGDIEKMIKAAGGMENADIANKAPLV